MQVSALNIAYEQTEISAPAGAAFTIHFDNKDPGMPHNVAIKDPSGTEVFKGDIITGPAQADYQVPALPAGTYQFMCNDASQHDRYAQGRRLSGRGTRR